MFHSYEKMELADSKTEEFPSSEIKIENFRWSTDKRHSTSIHVHRSRGHEIYYFVTALLNEETEGWLAVEPTINIHKGCIKLSLYPGVVFSWIVSIIDIDGNPRVPKSFEMRYNREIQLGGLSTENRSKTSYLERSFILSRADEFLPEGVLTLRCDIFFSWSGELSYPARSINDRRRSPVEDFFRIVPHRVCFKHDAQTGNPSYTFKVFDFTSRDAIWSQFHNRILGSESPISYDLSLDFLLFSSKSKADNIDISEHVWIFDARPDRFILCLNERKDSIGARLLKTSSLIRQCVEVPLKGQQENHIELQKVDSQTFRIVLFFLASGTLPNLEFGELKKVYEFSHLYEMEEMQRRCADFMAGNIEPENVFEKELKGIADLYSDEYLSQLLESRRQEILKKDLLRLKIDDRAYSDCYI